MSTSENESWLAALLGTDFLLWSPNVQTPGFLHWQRIYATRTIKATPNAEPLRQAEQRLVPTWERFGERRTVDNLVVDDHLSGVIVLHDGEVVLERYALGLEPNLTWQSSSMVKSISSTLIGAAIHQGHISSVDELVVDHVAELRDTPAYEAVTIRHLLQMCSGTEFTEDYEDLRSDVVQKYIKPIAERRPGVILDALTRAKRIHEPGTQFVYNTGDTFLLGLILKRATGMSVSDYCSDRIWQPMGMETDGYFTLDSDDGDEITGSCSGASLRDYARFGQLMLNDGVATSGERILPEGWVAEATAPSSPNFTYDLWQEPNAQGFQGYGYLWWVLREGTYMAFGVYGQWIYVVPDEKLVFVMIGAMPREPFMRAEEPAARYGGNQHGSLERVAFIDAVRHQLDLATP